MLKGNATKELFKKGLEMKQLGHQMEDCREKLNALSDELSLSHPRMLEMEEKFDELLITYMKKEAEAQNYQQILKL